MVVKVLLYFSPAAPKMIERMLLERGGSSFMYGDGLFDTKAAGGGVCGHDIHVKVGFALSTMLIDG